MNGPNEAKRSKQENRSKRKSREACHFSSLSDDEMRVVGESKGERERYYLSQRLLSLGQQQRSGSDEGAGRRAVTFSTTCASERACGSFVSQLISP